MASWHRLEEAGPGHNRGTIRWRQEVTITVSATADYPAWLSYRFHYQGPDGHCRFRYDNTPHHPELPHFPHHRHEGPAEEPVPHPQPSVAQVLREVARYLGPPGR